VPGYGGLSITIDRPDVDEAALDAQIDRMRDLDSTLEVVERPAQDGDTVTIDIAGTLDGDAQSGLTADDYSYTVGSGAITPEVDEHLVGAEAGASLSFPATHPDPEEERELQFELTLKDVKEKVLPEATDEWASEASEFDTVAELRASLADRMARVRTAQAQMALREKVGEALAELVADDIPEPLVAQEMQQRLQDLAMRLQAQGLTPEQWLAITGKSSDDLTAELREAAETSAKVDLALRAVAEAEQIECTDDDLDEELADVAERVGESVARVRQEFERGGNLAAVRSDVRKRKALDWPLERVEIVDEDGHAIDRADLEVSSDDHEHDTDEGPGEQSAAPETDETDTNETESDAR
jgi:trigger factor